MQLISIALSFGVCNAYALSANEYKSKFQGRWVINDVKLCTDPKFSGAGDFFNLDKQGQLTTELNLPRENRVALIRTSQIKKIEVLNDAERKVKVISSSQNVDKNEFYTVTTIYQFDDQFKTLIFIEQKRNDEVLIRNGVVLKTGKDQSPYYKCD